MRVALWKRLLFWVPAWFSARALHGCSHPSSAPMHPQNSLPKLHKSCQLQRPLSHCKSMRYSKQQARNREPRERSQVVKRLSVSLLIVLCLLPLQACSLIKLSPSKPPIVLEIPSKLTCPKSEEINPMSRCDSPPNVSVLTASDLAQLAYEQGQWMIDCAAKHSALLACVDRFNKGRK